MADSPYATVVKDGSEGVFVSDIPMMRMVSHEIEQTVLHHNLAIDLYVGFQQFSRFVPQIARYEEIAWTCRHVYVFGVPDVPVPPIPNVRYLPLREDMELAREWFVIAEGAQFFTALLTHEMSNDAPRRFEGIWTYDPTLVAHSVEVLCRMFNLPYTPVTQRNYQQQSQYLAFIFTRLMQARKEGTADQVLRRHRAALYQSGLSSSETPLLLLDKNKLVIAASPVACTILDTQQHELIGRTLTEVGNGLFVERDPTQVAPPLMALLRVTEDELLSASTKPITDGDGEHVGWVINLHQVQHRKQRYERRTLPIATLLHRYTNQIRAQVGALGLIGENTDVQPHAVRHIQTLVDSLERQIERLALLQDLEAQGDIRAETTALVRWVPQLANTWKITLDAYDIAFALQMEDALPLLWCSRAQIEMALNELRHNVEQHASGATHARLVVSHQQGYIHLSVQDNGCGLNQADQQTIFGAFSKPSERGPLEGERVGLGLAMARAIAKAHHGFLRIESTRGQGCVFTLMLPANSELAPVKADSEDR